MSTCCGSGVVFDGMSAAYRRRLWAVIALNAGMFVVEMAGGALADSKALQADALDFLGDALTYGISLAVIGRSVAVRSAAALAKGVSLALMGLWVFGSTIWHVFVLGVPAAGFMGLIGFLALLANLASVALLLRYKDGDANVRSVWLCSRNDAIGNVAVMVAALAVWATASGWPDVIVAGAMAALFINSSARIIAQALRERRASVHEPPVARPGPEVPRFAEPDCCTGRACRGEERPAAGPEPTGTIGPLRRQRSPPEHRRNPCLPVAPPDRGSDDSARSRGRTTIAEPRQGCPSTNQNTDLRPCGRNGPR